MYETIIRDRKYSNADSEDLENISYCMSLMHTVIISYSNTNILNTPNPRSISINMLDELSVISI